MAACRKGQQREELRTTDAPTRDVQQARQLLVLVLLTLLLADAEG